MSGESFNLLDYETIVYSIENDSEFHEYITSYKFAKECEFHHILYFFDIIMSDTRVEDPDGYIDVTENIKKILSYLNLIFPLTSKSDINDILRMDSEPIFRMFIICCLNEENKVINPGMCLKAMLEIDDLNPSFMDIYFEYFELTNPSTFEGFISSDGFRALWDRFYPIKDDLDDELLEMIDELATPDFKFHMEE